jgi:hypothetical protein
MVGFETLLFGLFSAGSLGVDFALELLRLRASLLELPGDILLAHRRRTLLAVLRLLLLALELGQQVLEPSHLALLLVLLPPLGLAALLELSHPALGLYLGVDRGRGTTTAAATAALKLGRLAVGVVEVVLQALDLPLEIGAPLLLGLGPALAVLELALQPVPLPVHLVALPLQRLALPGGWVSVTSAAVTLTRLGLT